ncbi:MAG: hypothetical protein K2L87_05665 [Clostridiales bacterium]|nr:hypothetical protein [Clostridiales bacterium]
MRKKSLRAAATCVAACALLGAGLTFTGCGEQEPTPEPTPKEVTLTVDRSVKYEMDKPYQGAWYTMFVYSFADSDGDGIGDIPGLIEKLDYLNDGDPTTTDDLGITGMWLLPIMPASTFHKYDIEDYYAIDPQYGTMEDFDRLIEECDKRGISVIIDLVLNCTSNKNPWFLDAVHNPDSPYREYYRFYNDIENKEDVNLDAAVLGYESWSRYDKDGNPYDKDSDIPDTEIAASLYAGYMPDLNYDNESTRNEIKKVAKFWLDKGCAGFRLDSAPHIYSKAEIPLSSTKTVEEYNYEFWTEFFDYCKTINPDTYLVGEVLTGNVDQRAEYMRSMKSDFDFGLIYSLRDEIKHPQSDNMLGLKLTADYNKYRKVTNDNYINAPFQTDADVNRMAGVFDNDPRKIKLAQMFSLTLEGLPFMYYGDEIGMLGNKNSGEIFKLSFPWAKDDPLQTTRLNYWNIYGKKADKSDYTQPFEEQNTDPNSVLSAIRTLIHIRCENEALFKGRYQSFTAASNIVSYKMVSDHQEAVMLHNMRDETVTFNFDVAGYKLLYMTYHGELKIVDGVITLDPYESIILAKEL